MSSSEAEPQPAVATGLDVSVVIPTHGRPGMVRDAVVSVTRQTLAPREIVVVCDGPDPRVVEALADLPVRLVEIPESGVAAARNAGVALAAGRWVAFLDDDNLWHPDFLSRVATHVRSNPSVRALDTGYWVFADPGEAASDEIDFRAETLDECLELGRTCRPVSTLDHLQITGRSFELLLARMRGSMSTAVVERELVLTARGFPVGVICAEDWTMFTNVARFTEWDLIPDRLAYLRVHGGGNTRARALLNGPATLRAIRDMWREDRLPWPEPRPTRRHYRDDYRYTVRSALTTALRQRRFDVYTENVRLARHLLGPSDLARAVAGSLRDGVAGG